MRRACSIVAWQFLPSENGAGEANDAESTADGGAALVRRRGRPHAATSAMPDEGGDAFGVALQDLSRENDGGAKILSRRRRNVEGARTSAGGRRRGRRAARAMLGARPCACRSLPRAVSTPRTLPLHVHGRHLDVSWRVVASCVTQHSPPWSQAHSSDATTAVGTSPEPPRFDDRVTGGRAVTCRAAPSRPSAAHTTDRLWKCGHLAFWARGPRPCGNSRPRCCAA